MSYFDNTGRDLGIFTIFGAVVTLGRPGTHYYLLLIPALYIGIGILVELHKALLKRDVKQKPHEIKTNIHSQVNTPIKNIRIKPRIRLKSRP